MSTLEENRVAIASRLKEARLLAGLSQAQVAELMELHRPTVSEIEAGRRRVAAEELAALSDLYGVSRAWLMGESSGTPSLVAEVAARELEKLSDRDLEALLKIIGALRRPEASGG